VYDDHHHIRVSVNDHGRDHGRDYDHGCDYDHVRGGDCGFLIPLSRRIRKFRT
jgi:hypothetical protein